MNPRPAYIAVSVRAATAFRQYWNGLLAPAIAGRLTCNETEALVGMFNAVGVPDAVISYWRACHGAADTPGQIHYSLASDSIVQEGIPLNRGRVLETALDRNIEEWRNASMRMAVFAAALAAWQVRTANPAAVGLLLKFADGCQNGHLSLANPCLWYGPERPVEDLESGTREGVKRIVTILEGVNFASWEPLCQLGGESGHFILRLDSAISAGCSALGIRP